MERPRLRAWKPGHPVVKQFGSAPSQWNARGSGHGNQSVFDVAAISPLSQWNARGSGHGNQLARTHPLWRDRRNGTPAAQGMETPGTHRAGRPWAASQWNARGSGHGNTAELARYGLRPRSL